MIDVAPYLDNANRPLWEELSTLFNISIEYSKEKCYGNYLKRDDCTICVLKDEEPDPASFSHELLHLYLPSKQIRIGCAIENMFKEQYPHCLIFDTALYDHISNCLNHIKMFPLFLQMGYPAEKFLQDYHDHKLTNLEVCEIKCKYKSGLFKVKYNIQGVNLFIGKFFAAKADVNPSNNYDNPLMKLKQIDPQLFSALDDFWNSWVEYEVDLHREVWENDYHQLVDKLGNDIAEWGKDKKVKIQ